jgi:uncharacterized protein (TIGR03435 family)
MRHTLVLTLIWANAWISNAQAPAFEVASVKRNTSDEPAGGSISPPAGGRFQANNVTLRTLIRTAYDVENFQISGGPKWIDSDKFDVNAKAAGNATWPDSRMMLQELLATRFKLSLSRESRTMPAYALVIGKNGPKLTPPTDPGCQPPPLGACSRLRFLDRKVLSGVNVSTAQLAQVLTTFMGRPVIDKTGLTSIFDFKIDFVLDLPMSEQAQGTDDGAAQSISPSVFTSLQEQLGLKLVPQKDPVELLVISYGEQPTPN